MTLRGRVLQGTAMFREGYVERTIQQLRQTFARLLGKVDRAEAPALLDARLDDLYRDHLGLSRQVLGSLDAASQARLLRERAPIAVELLRGEQALLAAAGRTAEAAEAGERLTQLETVQRA